MLLFSKHCIASSPPALTPWSLRLLGACRVGPIHLSESLSASTPTKRQAAVFISCRGNGWAVKALLNCRVFLAWMSPLICYTMTVDTHFHTAFRVYLNQKGWQLIQVLYLWGLNVLARAPDQFVDFYIGSGAGVTFCFSYIRMEGRCSSCQSEECVLLGLYTLLEGICAIIGFLQLFGLCI